MFMSALVLKLHSKIEDEKGENPSLAKQTVGFKMENFQSWFNNFNIVQSV